MVGSLDAMRQSQRVRVLLLLIFIIFSSINYSNVNSNNYNINISNKYLIIISNSSILLYLLSNNSVKLAPLSTFLNNGCVIELGRNNDGVVSFVTGGGVNLTLPNGTVVKFINIHIYVYTGCLINKQTIYNISVKQRIPGVLDVTLNILAPLPRYVSSFTVPAFLEARKATFVYTLINETHFEVNVTLYNVRVNELLYNTKEFNLNIKFIIDRRTWTAMYWNGREWVDAGILPVGAPDLNVTPLLYKFYINYLDNINYYINNQDELMKLIERLKILLDRNETEAYKLLMRAVNAPLPAEWKERKLFYLNVSYLLDVVSGSARALRTINYTLPEYYALRVFPNPEALKNSDAIVKAVVKYLIKNDTSDLEELIEKTNFTRYVVNVHRGGTISLADVFKNGVLPSTSPSLMMVLPVDGLRGLPPGLARGVSAVILDIENDLGSIRVRHGATVEFALGELGQCRDCLLVAVDDRLAQDWMLTLNSTISYRRASILYNMWSVVVTKYINALQEIVEGGNAVEKLEEVKEYLKIAVLTAAYELGGEPGLERIRALIAAPSYPASGPGVETGETSTPGPPGGATAASTVTGAGGALTSSAPGGGRGGRGVVLAAAVLAVVGVVAVYVYVRRFKAVG